MRHLLLPLALLGCGDTASTDDAGVPDLSAPDLAPAGPACSAENPHGAAFDTGEPGTTSRTLAGDFTVPTLDGDFTLSTAWTGCDSFLFIPYNASSPSSKALWSSSLDDLLTLSPPGVHYVFASFSATTAMADVTEIKSRVDAALANLSAEDQAHWKPRFHYITAGVRTLGNWISTWLARPQLAFGIDRLQRIREVGLLAPVTGQQNPPELDFLAYEARYYDFEWSRQQTLHDAKIIHVFDGTTMDQTVVVDFPDAKTMAGYDTMELDLGMWCKDHLEANCAQWDYIQDLVLCDSTDPPPDAGAGSPPACASGTIIGRFITTYHREGRWIVDVSPLLALLQQGGRRALHYNSQYLNQLDIRLSNAGKGGRPSQAIPLWNGEWSFDQTYNTHFTPKSIPIPADASRVQLFSFISGHGFGTDKANCAEFCNHEHRFTVGSTEYLKDFPMAGSPDGCIEEIAVGTVPNQYGTWPFGRGGWCPGLPVIPFVADVTADAPAGATATVAYRGTFNGKDYVPVPQNGMNGGFGALIRLQSWLVIWTR
jgi:Peptide-N-glycosidase F, C terminal